MRTLLTGPSFSSNKMKKKAFSRPAALSDEGFHGKAAMVGSLAFFNFGTERGGMQYVLCSNCFSRIQIFSSNDDIFVALCNKQHPTFQHVVKSFLKGTTNWLII